MFAGEIAWARCLPLLDLQRAENQPFICAFAVVRSDSCWKIWSLCLQSFSRVVFAQRKNRSLIDFARSGKKSVQQLFLRFDATDSNLSKLRFFDKNVVRYEFAGGVLCLNPLSLLSSFAPWIVFRIVIALPFADPLFRVKIALVLASLICAWQAKKATKGFVFWGTVAFFSFSLITVVFMTNMFVLSHLSLLSQATLGGIVWGSIFLRRPFTIDYAKRFVPEEYWTHPLFLRKNYIISGAWGLYFLLGIAMALTRTHLSGTSPAILHGIDIAAMTAVILFTSHSSKQQGGA